MAKIDREKEIVNIMISLFCYKKHGHNYDLCEDCSNLLEYSHDRLDNCRLGERKISCRACPIHCYNFDMRTRIREVMRFSGPRLALYRPLDAAKHIFR